MRKLRKFDELFGAFKALVSFFTSNCCVTSTQLPLKLVAVHSIISPRDSEAKAAAQQNNNAQNNEEHQTDDVPVNHENRSERNFKSPKTVSRTTTLIHAALLCRAIPCSRVKKADRRTLLTPHSTITKQMTLHFGSLIARIQTASGALVDGNEIEESKSENGKSEQSELS